jgi:3-dehydroquinate synthase
MENKIQVALQERSYEIFIAPDSVRCLSSFLTNRAYSKIFIITDENVARHHLAKISEVLQKIKISVETIITRASEQIKSFSFLQEICETILAKGIDRKSLIIAFGGGVIGDLAGFTASILLRGIDFIQIPTTLLAAVDSSVGGKTAINAISGKNLIGSFYQPQLVICDLNFLKTLPRRELLCGYAETVKYGFIRDEDFFCFLEENYQKLFDFDAEFLQKIISRSCKIKAEIVSDDEKESGIRALLNFGHTFGHVFETAAKYSAQILHGEAVSLGMTMAAKMSQNLAMISQEEFLRIKRHLDNVGLVTSPKKIRKIWDKENLVNHLYKDKKHENQNLTFILLKKIGEAAIVKEVNLHEFDKIMQEFL